MEMTIIRVPRALDGLEPLTFEMGEIYRDYHRQEEVAMVNSIRAPELLTVFNRNYLTLSRYINILQYEIDVANRRLEEAKAILIIDKLPGLLSEKGLSSPRSPLGSEDVRQAFLSQDADYQRFRQLLEILNLHLTNFETYRKGFENSYNSVKKLIGTDPSSWRPNPNLTQPAPSSPSPSPGLPSNDFKVTSEGLSDDFFGTPR